MSGGEFVYALSFLYKKTNVQRYRDDALLIANYHWRSRHPETGLIPNSPHAGAERFDGSHCDTSVTGILCYFLLKSYEMTGIEIFRDQALVYLRAYAKYGYDTEMLKAARRWAEVIRKHPPSEGCAFDPTTPGYETHFAQYGTFADYYGRTISFFVHLYAMTGEEPYLNDARRFAREAVSRPVAKSFAFFPPPAGRGLGGGVLMR